MKLRKDRAEQRRQEAKIRQAEYDKLSPKQKLERLDNAFGKGEGAKKQRAKIAEQIASAKSKPAPQPKKEKA